MDDGGQLGGDVTGPGSAGFLIGPVFLALAAWFVWGLDTAAVPPASTPGFDKVGISTKPLRKTLSDPPTIHLHEFDRTCMECHMTFLNETPLVTELGQHKQIKLQHGVNNHCFDCHHVKDRDSLVLRRGKKISFDQVIELCAQCHVSIHRDWLMGLHGRRLGHWDTSQGERRQLGCTECHDPHRPRHPAMQRLKPLPGPNTLRMGTPTEHTDHGAEDPLRRAGMPSAGSSHDEAHKPEVSHK